MLGDTLRDVVTVPIMCDAVPGGFSLFKPSAVHVAHRLTIPVNRVPKLRRAGGVRHAGMMSGNAVRNDPAERSKCLAACCAPAVE